MRLFSVLILFINSVTAYDKIAATFEEQDCKKYSHDSICGCTYFTTDSLTHRNWIYGYESECLTLCCNFNNRNYDIWAFAAKTKSDHHKSDDIIMNNGHDTNHCYIANSKRFDNINQNARPYLTDHFDGYIDYDYTYVGASDKYAFTWY